MLSHAAATPGKCVNVRGPHMWPRQNLKPQQSRWIVLDLQLFYNSLAQWRYRKDENRHIHPKMEQYNYVQPHSDNMKSVSHVLRPKKRSSITIQSAAYLSFLLSFCIYSLHSNKFAFFACIHHTHHCRNSFWDERWNATTNLIKNLVTITKAIWVWVVLFLTQLNLDSRSKRNVHILWTKGVAYEG